MRSYYNFVKLGRAINLFVVLTATNKHSTINTKLIFAAVNRKGQPAV